MVTKAGILSSLLLAHYDQWGRRLPWRETCHPYAIWLAEVMLQQTGVATVIPYYHRFLHHFPTVEALAAADGQQVLTLWQGLGYYRRAHNLHKAAQLISQQGFPTHLAGWLALPGIGENTAAAIMAIAHNAPTAILDGNVKRVLARLIALATPVEENLPTLWQLAHQLTDQQRPGDYAQAIMDLGATVCLPRHPLCGQCPWSGHCAGLATGRPIDYPVVVAKVKKPRLLQRSILLQRGDGAFLMVRRPEEGLLAGLWQPPSTPPTLELPALEGFLAELGVTARLEKDLPLIKHTFTHFHLTVHPHLYTWLAGIPRLVESWCWTTDPATLPLATLHRKILATHPPLARLVKG